MSDNKVSVTMDGSIVQFKNNKLPKCYLFRNGYRLKSKNDYCTHYMKTVNIDFNWDKKPLYDRLAIFHYKNRSEIVLIRSFNEESFDWCDSETTFKYITLNEESLLKYIELVER